MLDFSKDDLYENRKKEMDDFLEVVMVTKEERKLQIIEEREEDISEEELNEDLSSFIGEAGGIDNIIKDDSESESNKSEDILDEAEKLYETGDYWKNILYAPYFLFYYIFRSLFTTFSYRSNFRIFLRSLLRVSAVTSIFSLVLVLFTDARFIFSLEIQAVVSISMFVISLIVSNLISKAGILEEKSEVDIFGDGIEYMDSHPLDTEFSASLSDVEDEISDDEFLDYQLHQMLNQSTETSIIVEEKTNVGGSPIPHSIMDVNKPMDEFLNDLRLVYDRNDKHKDIEYNNRRDLVLSLSDYLIANDKTFGTWDILEERSTVYNNIMYTMYLALTEISTSFSDTMDSNNKMYVLDARENPLMYKIEIEVPKKYFKENTLKTRIDTIKAKLRKSEDDLHDSISIYTYQEGFVIKLFKDVKGFVSLGDILRYSNESDEKQAYDHFLGDKMGLPLVLGLRNNEYPTVIDLAENTSVVIAGESGSGKSWGTFLVMLNLIVTNSYNDLNLVVMDRKKAVFWREFARLPHVIGYHTDVQDYFDILAELKLEMEYRKDILDRAGKEDWKSLRKDLQKEGEFEALKAFPWSVIIMDEIANVMNEVSGIAGKDNKHILDGFIDDLATLAQEGRSLGMKLILIGQRTTDKAMPRNNLANSSMKMFFKLTAPDVERGGFDLKNLELPSLVGQALLQDAGLSGPVFLRTLTVGGISNDQIINLIRVLGFEWTRRSLNDTLQYSPHLAFTSNREIIREKVIEDMENGELFISTVDKKVLGLAEALRSGQDITKMASSDLVPLVVEKEDDKGNIISEIDIRNVIEDSDEDEITPVVKVPESKVGIKINKTPSKSITTEPEVVEKVEKESETNNEEIPTSVMTPVPKKKVIVSQTMRKNVKRDKKSALSDLKEARVGKNTDTEIKVSESSGEKISIKNYIIENGEGNTIKKMRRSDIEKLYSVEEIKKELNNMRITIGGDYYHS